MRNQAVIVVDNFYENPEEIRQLAKSLSYYRKSEATYPGAEAYILDPRWDEVRNILRSYIQEDVDAPSPKKEPFLQGKFRIATSDDENTRLDYVHEDVQKWSGIIYLSLPEHCQGGVAFYKHKKTGALSSTREWFNQIFSHLHRKDKATIKAEIQRVFKDPNEWEMVGQIPMKYNRAVMLMGQCFHGSTGVFGNGFENGRLTQHFEFYSPNDASY